MSEMAEGKREGVTQAIKTAAETLTIIGIGNYYAIGFLIGNSYLLFYNYSNPSIFKATYLSAGVLF